jgi:protein CpxP
MKSLIKFAVIMVVAAGVLGAMSGCASNFMHRSPQERAEWLVKNISDELKLNDAQLSKLNAFKDEMLAVRSEYRKKHGDVPKTVDELLSQPTLDQARVLAQIKERTQEVNDQAPRVVSAFAAFYDSLTPVQQKKLHDEVAERMEHHHGYWDDE